jgi:hypothetical protein
MSTKPSIESETVGSESDSLWTLLENRDKSLGAAHRKIQEQVQTIDSLKNRLNQKHGLEEKNSLILEVSQQQQKILDLEQELNDLKDQLKEQEKVYSSLSNDLHIVNSSLRRHNANLNHKNRDQNRTVNQLRQQLQKKNSQLQQRNKRLQGVTKRFQQDVKSLEDEIERLKVGRVALKQVTLSVLRRFGKPSRPVGSQGDRPTSSPVAATLPAATTLATSELGAVPDATADASAPQLLAESESSVETTAPAESLTQDKMTSDPVETLIMLKGITDRGYPDINTDAFEFFSQLVSTAQRILCIQPTKKLAALAQAFACRGIDITCAGCADALLPSLESGKVHVLSEGWLSLITETYQSSLADFDVVLLNGHLPENDARNLSYRLAPTARLVVHDYELTAEAVKASVVSGSDNRPMALGTPDATYSNFRLYKAPPVPLIDPLHPLPDSHPHQQWPWNYPVAPVPATYPSGKPLPKISVITVTFNQGPYLEETIRSVLMQGYPNLEYIVIDGCSTDNTSAILERYRDELTHCIVEPDNGQSDALNKGFRLATGDILAWLNSDDCYLPQALFRVAIAFENSDVDMVVGGCQLRHDFSPVPFQTHHSIFPLGAPASLPLERLLDLENCWKQGEFFYQPEVFWTKELWEKSGAHVNAQLFYSMDYELWLRMAQNEAKILHIPDPIALYRMHEAQKTYGDALPYYPELEQVAKRFR